VRKDRIGGANSGLQGKKGYRRGTGNYLQEGGFKRRRIIKGAVKREDLRSWR
jgi:hypothetical protein